MFQQFFAQYPNTAAQDIKLQLASFAFMALISVVLYGMAKLYFLTYVLEPKHSPERLANTQKQKQHWADLECLTEKFLRAVQQRDFRKVAYYQSQIESLFSEKDRYV